MLPKKYKLKSSLKIDRVFKNGKTVKSSFLFLKTSPAEEELPQIAVSIGLKYSKKAVERNRAKRILRQAVNEFVQEIKPGNNLVFFFEKNFQDSKQVNFENIKKVMKDCLISANLLK